MKRLVHVAVLAAAAPAAASPWSGSWDGKPRAYPPSGIETRDDRGHVVATKSKNDSADTAVLDDKDGRVLLGFDGSAVRLALWVDKVAPVTTRPVALAASAKAKPPRPGDDGVFLDPGAPVAVDEVVRDRAHVHLEGGLHASGWIPRDAIGTRFVPIKPPGDIEVIGTMGARVLARDGHELASASSDEVVWVRKLAGGRAEVYWHNARAVGRLDTATDDDDEDNGVEGGVEGGMGDPPPPPKKETVPQGACVFSGDGVPIGVVARRRGDAGSDLEIDVSTDKVVKVRVLVFALDWDVPVYLHRAPDRKGWETCP